MIVTTLQDVLLPFSTVERLALGTARALALQRNTLKKALADARADNRKVFLIFLCMIVCLFSVAVVGVVLNLNHPEVVWGINSAFGGLSAFLFYFLLRVWREISRMNLVLMLTEFMDMGALQTLVNELVKPKLHASPPPVEVPSKP